MSESYAIELKNITKRFGKVTANDKVCLSVKKGEILSILGENGSGKTTLMNMISGIYYPDEGQILVNGKEVTIRSPKDSFALGIGMIHQHFKLVDVLTAAENIILGLSGKEILDMKSVAAKINELTSRYGFDLDPNQKIYTMSVSQKQTVEIVKLLYRGVDILILDEPTVGLDPKQIIEIRELIRQLAKKHTVILSSHILAEVREVCDYILIISKGKLVASDTPENLERNLGDSDLIEIETKADPDEVRRILEIVDGIRSISTKHLENGITWAQIQEKKNTDVREKVFQAFAQNHQPLLKLNPLQVSLEDVFMELTQSDRAAEEYAEKAKKKETEDMKDAGDL